VSHTEDTWAHPVLLGSLLSGPRHGYELYRELQRDLAGVWQIGLSQLYAQLKQLEEAGLVAAQTEPQPNRPPRKVYHVTDKGRELFFHWLHRPSPYLRLIRVEFLLRLYLCDRLSLPVVDQLVAAQRAVCREQADRFAQAAAEAQSRFRRLVLEFRQGQMEAVIRWLDRCSQVQSGAAVLPAGGEHEQGA
jgi:DNA-binding PadR family transcriptional regulator